MPLSTLNNPRVNKIEGNGEAEFSQSDEEFMLRAPGDGYSNTITKSYHQIQNNGRETIRFHVRSKTRKLYAAFSLEVAPSTVTVAVMAGEMNVEGRVRQMQGLRGVSFSNKEREAALAFLAGKELPEGMGRSSVDWLSDELLTTLRLQEPPWDGLAAALGEVAFHSGTNPVVRDYIMQHLGHLWEQNGARQEIETALWKAVGTLDETTPGTALIALSRGYTRDQRDKDVAKVPAAGIRAGQESGYRPRCPGHRPIHRRRKRRRTWQGNNGSGS